MFKWLFGPVLYPKADRLGTYAAALAYCVVLSLVPFLVVTFAVGLQITSQLALKNDVYASSYAQVLHDILPMENPKETARIFTTVRNSTTPTKTGLITAVISFGFAIYTSFNLMDQIFRTLLFIFDDSRKPIAWTWKVMAKTFGLLAIWMCLLLLLSVSAVGATGLRALLDRFLFSSLSEALVTILQVMLIVSALFGTFFLTYYVVPHKNYKHKYVIEGSAVASIGWILCSLVFAYVIPKLLRTSAAYLALGSVVAILLWAQACAWSIIIGACWIVRFSPKPK
jgi:YihY family inner membrane protein